MKKAKIKLGSLILLLLALLTSCRSREKDRQDKENALGPERSHVQTLLTKYNAVSLDSLFKSDSSRSQFSYKTEGALLKLTRPILAKASLEDIVRVTDSTFQLTCAVQYRRGQSQLRGSFFGEFTGGDSVVRNIEALGLENKYFNRVYLLVKVSSLRSIDYEIEGDIEDVGDEENPQAEVVLDLTFSSRHRAKGVCIGVESISANN